MYVYLKKANKHSLAQLEQVSVIFTILKWVNIKFDSLAARAKGLALMGLAGANLWNSLPMHIRDSPTYNTFKSRLKKLQKSKPPA